MKKVYEWLKDPYFWLGFTIGAILWFVSATIASSEEIVKDGITYYMPPTECVPEAVSVAVFAERGFHLYDSVTNADGTELRFWMHTSDDGETMLTTHVSDGQACVFARAYLTGEAA